MFHTHQDAVATQTWLQDEFPSSSENSESLTLSDDPEVQIQQKEQRKEHRQRQKLLRKEDISSPIKYDEVYEKPELRVEGPNLEDSQIKRGVYNQPSISSQNQQVDPDLYNYEDDIYGTKEGQELDFTGDKLDDIYDGDANNDLDFLDFDTTPQVSQNLVSEKPETNQESKPEKPPLLPKPQQKPPLKPKPGKLPANLVKPSVANEKPNLPDLNLKPPNYCPRLAKPDPVIKSQNPEKLNLQKLKIARPTTHFISSADKTKKPETQNVEIDERAATLQETKSKLENLKMTTQPFVKSKSHANRISSTPNSYQSNYTGPKTATGTVTPFSYSAGVASETSRSKVKIDKKFNQELEQVFKRSK